MPPRRKRVTARGKGKPKHAVKTKTAPKAKTFAQIQQTLSGKDKKIYHSVFSLYDSKNYTEALKAATKFLNRVPNHCEILAMKGISTYHVSSKEEGWKIVNQAVTLARTDTHIPHHVKALMTRSEARYSDAMPIYEAALKAAPVNSLILRDYGSVAMQVRDFPKAAALYTTLRREHGESRGHWGAAAVASYLAGKYQDAMEAVEGLLRICGEEKNVPDHEISGIMYFRNQIIEKLRGRKAALADINEVSSVLMDREEFLHRRAALSKGKAGKQDLQALLARNPEDPVTLDALIRMEAKAVKVGMPETPASGKVKPTSGGASGVSGIPCWDLPLRGGALSLVQEHLREHLEQYPKASGPQLALLGLLSAESPEFETRLSRFIEPLAMKGATAIYRLLTSVLNNTSRRAVLAKLIKEHKAASAVTAETETDTAEEKKKTSVSSSDIAWSLLETELCLVEQGPEAALESLLPEEGLAGDALLDVMQCRLRILQSAGRNVEGAELAVRMSEIDSRDRNINTLRWRAQLLAGQHAEAIETIGLFIAERDAWLYTCDMQAFDTLGAMLHCHLGHCASGNPTSEGPLAKCAMVILKAIWDHLGDGMDFHQYCVRRGDLGNYARMCQDWVDIAPERRQAVQAAVILSALSRRPAPAGGCAEEIEQAEEDHTARLASHSKEGKRERDPDPWGWRFIAAEEHMATLPYGIRSAYGSVCKHHSKSHPLLAWAHVEVLAGEGKGLLAIQALEKLVAHSSPLGAVVAPLALPAVEKALEEGGSVPAILRPACLTRLAALEVPAAPTVAELKEMVADGIDGDVWEDFQMILPFMD
eukprot:gnl/Dysnectes_brevis/747_a820_1685.p1 GENE.gnl/Dysnectes_brevis/747_a820_1685~~gnl/Dysnectes_brevis/747_a820_1685.p1  ORF type:complete len:834 (+),score=283.02 gnl/Dysnectes_brevis/747_a820_1685:42-2504(+)